MRLALELLGKSAKVTQARLIQPAGYEVDLFGNAVLENNDGLCAQVSFGMDNAYQFLHSIERFCHAIQNLNVRKEVRTAIQAQCGKVAGVRSFSEREICE